MHYPKGELLTNIQKPFVCVNKIIYLMKNENNNGKIDHINKT